MTRQQAHRHVIRIPLWWVQLALLVLSALVTAIAGWYLLSVLFSLAQYVPSLP